MRNPATKLGALIRSLVRESRAMNPGRVNLGGQVELQFGYQDTMIQTWVLLILVQEILDLGSAISVPVITCIQTL